MRVVPFLAAWSCEVTSYETSATILFSLYDVPVLLRMLLDDLVKKTEESLDVPMHLDL